MFQWMSKKLNQKRKGFTLIELVVVVAILGILAAIAIPRLSQSRATAGENAHQANLRTIESAIGLYQAETGNLPATMNDLVPKYLQENPDNPLTTNKAPGYTLAVVDPTGNVYAIPNGN